ncbi:uncharacterized protein LOC116656221 [Drosophila ananassae]|uniref:uncharacterized protein LOC116656212 n=1 Tax=Drosophila ananassae TaxID=7217 RepID=UPI0013A5C48C|nr:uncharacterized protein LOC116656212 [Drosophila ananassae]XP_032311556.1 uncharacterized protein LOC116656214 [Drosophila ananassae]XP_032311562.1 uncharacterized protein LOC116656220 [Drosophila ananassae]XP_032311564.1 uncharacterized protein LOC116656221 [Drosophila ananassae]
MATFHFGGLSLRAKAREDSAPILASVRSFPHCTSADSVEWIGLPKSVQVLSGNKSGNEERRSRGGKVQQESPLFLWPVLDPWRLGERIIIAGTEGKSGSPNESERI